MEKVRTKRVSGGDGDDDDNGEKDNTKIKRTLQRGKLTTNKTYDDNDN